MTTIIELLRLLERLEIARISFTLSHNRKGAITIEAHVPGEKWEIDILADGEVDIEVFRSDGEIHAAPSLQQLFDRFAD